MPQGKFAPKDKRFDRQGGDFRGKGGHLQAMRQKMLPGYGMKWECGDGGLWNVSADTSTYAVKSWEVEETKRAHVAQGDFRQHIAREKKAMEWVEHDKPRAHVYHDPTMDRDNTAAVPAVSRGP